MKMEEISFSQVSTFLTLLQLKAAEELSLRALFVEDSQFRLGLKGAVCIGCQMVVDCRTGKSVDIKTVFRDVSWSVSMESNDSTLPHTEPFDHNEGPLTLGS